MNTKYMKSLVSCGLIATFFVACGDLEEKKIIGHDVKTEFLQTHADTFVTPSNKSITFQKNGTVIHRQSKVIKVKIWHNSGTQYYISDEYANNVELIEEPGSLPNLKSQDYESQLAEVKCTYRKVGKLTSLRTIPREYPIEKLEWGTQDIVRSYPDANYLMQMNFKEEPL